VQEGSLSPIEVIDAHLTRVRERNKRTNAFVTITDDLAHEMAVDAERAVQDGEPLGPLHGVPVAIKDLNDVDGVRTTSGSLLLKDSVAEEDDPFVARLKQAGAVIIGKTNTPEFGVGTTTDNRITGATKIHSILTEYQVGHLEVPQQHLLIRLFHSHKDLTWEDQYARLRVCAEYMVLSHHMG